MLSARDEKHAFHAENVCSLSEHHPFNEVKNEEATSALYSRYRGTCCVSCTSRDGIAPSHVHVGVYIWSSKCCSLH